MSAVPLEKSEDDGRGDAMLQARMLIGDDLAGVNALIVERMESEVPLIPELARHLIAAGGKRIR
ncbi:MAG: polyprenyl synthetase family protein, partial [Geminicoccaceae bacterium]|nr:polyprenyl synthetase family protein [Geminicoccaceae bacterium]